MAQGDDYKPSAQSLYALRTESPVDLAARGLQRLVWRTVTPYPAGGAVALTPGLAIVGTGEGYFGFIWDDPGGAVVAVERKTGTIRWQTDLDTAIWGPVAVRYGRVFCPLRCGDLAALDLADGHVVWRKRLASGEPEGPDKIPLTEIGAVHAGPAVTDPFVYAVSAEGWLFVLDAADGAVLEKHPLNDPASTDELEGWCVSSPLVVGGRVYVGSETGGLQCFVGTDAAP
jgi:outer membrane protein assembly factor BamB